jgi:integrase
MKTPERKETVKVNFTKRVLEAVRVPKEGRVTLRDTEERGLGFMVTSAGHKTFFWFRKVNGRPEYKSVGEFPSTSIDAARRKAREFNSQRDQIRSDGVGNMFERRDADTFGTVFEQYMEYRAKNFRGLSWKKDQRLKESRDAYERHLKTPLGRLKLSQITKDQLKKIHLSIDGHRAANRTVQLVRTVINYAIQEEIWIGMNPAKCGTKRGAKGLALYKENQRRTVLSDYQLKCLLPHIDGDLLDFIALALTTGARKSNVLAMRFDQVAWTDQGWVWEITETKTDEPYLVALVPSAVEVLERRPGAHCAWRPGVKVPNFGGTWVFPSNSKTGHLTDVPRKGWTEAREAAGLPDITIHDLRRTLGTRMAQNGDTAVQIAKALNHKSLVSTQIYMRLAAEDVRPHLQRATTGLLNA